MNTGSNLRFLAHRRESDGVEQSVQEHLVGVADRSAALAGKVGLASLGELIGLVHDLGKYSHAFQTYIGSGTGMILPDEDEFIDVKEMKGKIDHSSSGAQYIWHGLRQRKEVAAKLAGQIMALCVASHHSGLADCLSPDGSDTFTVRMNKSGERTHFDEVCKSWDAVVRARVNKLLVSPVLEKEMHRRLESLAHGERHQAVREFWLGLLVRFLFSALIDADRVDAADFERPAIGRERYSGVYPDWKTLIDKLERHNAEFGIGCPIDKIRSGISSACKMASTRGKGLYTLTVPTGGGKTLASLRFALHHAWRHHMDRVIYVLPYTSIIDQNAAVVRSILENAAASGENGSKPIVLEHHSNLTPEKDTWQSRVLSENWDAPIIFTTAVQFLETLFSAGTRGARRMHQLANAVIVFDEIQSVPVRTVHLFNNAINFLTGQCGATILFCTATQPLLNEVNAEKGVAKLSPNHELMDDAAGLFKALRRVEVMDRRKNGGWTEDEVAGCALEELERTGSVLVVVNTKAAAREVYERCGAKAKRVFHLSTNMCPAHRMDSLQAIRNYLDPKAPKSVICVSTQLIEAGVDIDFGTVIRYLAGLDSIAQAAGRCNRNGLRPTGSVHVVNPAHENLDMLHDIRVGKEKADRVMDEYRANPGTFCHDLLSPQAMAQYYRYYFFERAGEMDYPVGTKQVGRDDTLLRLLSTNALSVEAYKRANQKAPPCIMRQSFRSAFEAFRVIDAPTEGIIVPYGDQGKRIIADLCSTVEVEKRYDLIRKAQRFSVNVFPNIKKKLTEQGCLREVQTGSGIMCLDPQHYSPEFGLSIEQVEPMEFLNA